MAMKNNYYEDPGTFTNQDFNSNVIKICLTVAYDVFVMGIYVQNANATSRN